jgi:hypothetical protein
MKLVPKYINWFVEEKDIVLEDGIPITCYILDYVVNEDVYCELALLNYQSLLKTQNFQ